MCLDTVATPIDRQGECLDRRCVRRARGSISRVSLGLRHRTHLRVLEIEPLPAGPGNREPPPGGVGSKAHRDHRDAMYVGEMNGEAISDMTQSVELTVAQRRRGILVHRGSVATEPPCCPARSASGRFRGRRLSRRRLSAWRLSRLAPRRVTRSAGSGGGFRWVEHLLQLSERLAQALDRILEQWRKVRRIVHVEVAFDRIRPGVGLIHHPASRG